MSCRFCLRSLRLAALRDEVPVGSLVLAIAADHPGDVPCKNGFAGHSAAEWPAGAVVMVGLLADKPSVLEFARRSPHRLDGGRCYRKVDPHGGDGWRNWKLRNQKHPFRGTRARQRAANVFKKRARERRARQRSGLSWSRYVARRHQVTYFQGAVLMFRRYAMGVANGALAGPLRGLAGAAVAQPARCRNPRFDFPMYVRPGDQAWLSFLRQARAAVPRGP